MTHSRIRVAQVLAGAAQGGAENCFVRTVAGMNELDSLQVGAFIRNHQHRIDALTQAGVETRGYRFGSPLDLFDRFRFRRELNAFDPDIVMTWMNRATAYTPNSDRYILVNRLGHYYKLKYYQHSDYWVGITKGICKHLIDGGFPADRVFQIPNFADEREVDPLPRNSFDTPTDRPLILAAGRLHVNKGFDVLLHSLTEIPDAILWLAGSGPEEQSLKQLCSQLGLDERVRFLGWRTDVTALMRTADLFVCPSRHEGLGSIVVESWAHRCPIVATRSQGPGELISDGVSGLLTPIDDAPALTQAIRSVLDSEELRNKLVAGAAEVYADGYSKQHIIGAYENLYQELMRRR